MVTVKLLPRPVALVTSETVTLNTKLDTKLFRN
jgi:hypothetical protein